MRTPSIATLLIVVTRVSTSGSATAMPKPSHSRNPRTTVPWYHEGMTNTECPAHESHWQNAAERLFPGVAILNAEQTEAVDIEAAAEYAACEGH